MAHLHIQLRNLFNKWKGNTKIYADLQETFVSKMHAEKYNAYREVN